MRIDGLTLDLRERNAWEAFDLGIALARSTGVKLFVPFAVVFVLLAVVIGTGNYVLDGPVWLVALILWWLKPAVDRVALAVLAQAVFSAAPDWRQTLRTLKNIPRTGLLWGLTIGRLDFVRSFHLPVRQLEGQTGKPGRERIKVLDKKLRGHALWFTLAIWHFIFILVYGVSGLIGLLAPADVHATPNLFFLFTEKEDSLLNQYLFLFAYVLSECLLEPYYVAGGFALYLSRRTALEGWDLEVAFKRMAARIEEHVLLAAPVAPTPTPAPPPAAPAPGSALGTSVLGLLLAAALALGSALPAPAHAQDADDDDDDAPAMVAPAPIAAASSGAQAGKPASKEKLAIGQVLAAPEFNEFKNKKVWRYRGKEDNKAQKPSWLGDGFLRFIEFLGQLMRGGIWVLAVVLLGWLLYMLVRHFGWFKNVLKMDRVKPTALFGLDLRPESLPDDIPAAARELLAGGDMRAALALLYRGALSVLVHERDVDIVAGDTEGDCVRRVARLGVPAMADYFARLVDAWGLIAYAGRKPETAAVTQLIDTWGRHFAPAEPRAAPGAEPQAAPA